MRSTRARLATGLLVATIIGVLFAAFSSVQAYATDGGAKYKTLSDFRGSTVSMVNGMAYSEIIEENEVLQGDVKIAYQNSEVDGITSLLAGKCNAFATVSPVALHILSLRDELMVFPEKLRIDQYGYGFAKGSALVEPFNEAMHKLKNEGIEKKLSEKWMGDDESAKVLINQDWEGRSGTLRYWVNVGTPPMGYLGPDGTPIGYGIDYLLHIARELDYRVEITECAFDGLIPALQGGKADVVGRSMNITEERKKMIDFSDPFFEGAAVFIVRKQDVDPSVLAASGISSNEVAESKDESFIDSIANSFEMTFIKQDRWKIFLSGLGVTLLITLSSALCGTVLGFLVYLVCRNRGVKVARVAHAISGVIVGIPVVVLLMVVFYIIFGSVPIGGVPVSIITFTLTFGVAVFSIMESGAAAIDVGQTEGAYALGFTDRETYFNVILPQALVHMLPIFRSELTSLLKATAVVGYIAVQDLTRAGDMIRNRTFEAFFALISVAIIYYVLGKVLSWLVNRVQVLIDPTRRSSEEILKGIDVHV